MYLWVQFLYFGISNSTFLYFLINIIIVVGLDLKEDLILI